ncbi:MAG: DVUA0089 family protein, partial [Pseudomonadota bacterium]
MCTVCAMTQSFVPERHETGEQIFDDIAPQSATIDETGDAAGGISTSYTMSVGDSFAGEISNGGDVDWVAITFEAGQTYEIDALGSDSGGGSLLDTDLRLYDASGELIEFDDFDGAGWDASISYTAASSGTYYIAVSSYFAANTGSYSLEVGAAIPTYVPGTEASVDQLAQFLREGSSGGERKFNTSTSNEIT